MSGWTLAVAVFNRSLTTDITARVLAVLGGLNVGFLAFYYSRQILSSEVYLFILRMEPI